MEYEHCAERYENIYKALWTNFSYMAIVSGAILTFGGERFEPEFSALLACLPLLFWWLSSFEPLNRYGDHAAERLDWIEIVLNETYGLWSRHQEKPEGMSDQKWEIEQHKGLGHWREFFHRKQARRHGADPRSATSNSQTESDSGLERLLRFAFASLFTLCTLFLAVRVGRFWDSRPPWWVWCIGAMVALLLSWLYAKNKESVRKIWEGTNVSYLEYFELTILKLLRVRNSIRAFFFLLAFVALMLGYRVVFQFPREGKSLIRQKASEVKVVGIGLKDASGNIRLVELNTVEVPDSSSQSGESGR
jgi:hypothetical protein